TTHVLASARGPLRIATTTKRGTRQRTPIGRTPIAAATSRPTAHGVDGRRAPNAAAYAARQSVSPTPSLIVAAPALTNPGASATIVAVPSGATVPPNDRVTSRCTTTGNATP